MTVSSKKKLVIMLFSLFFISSCTQTHKVSEQRYTDVLDFGAKADTSSDDTIAFQKALDKAGKKGGVVFVPAGNYLLNGTLNIPDAVTLSGVWQAPHHTKGGKGTVLYTTANRDNEEGQPFITLHNNSCVKGITIFYPQQDYNDVRPYPWCIRAGTTMPDANDMCISPSIIDVTLINPYKGVDFGTNHNELHYISNLYGQPLKTGIYVNRVTDIGRIENVHFNPHFWMRSGLPNAPKESTDEKYKLFEYLKQNFTGFIISRTDWEYMTNCFVIFPKIGYHFIKTTDYHWSGKPNVVLTQCGADVTSLSVLVEDSQGHAGIAFENSQFMGTVIIAPTNNGPVKFTNCGFWPIQTTQEQVIVDGEGTVILNACHFADWKRKSNDASYIRIDGGTALISNCDFSDNNKPQIKIKEKASAVTVIGCRFRGGEKIINESSTVQLEKGFNITK
jgi:hypothetical protein